MAVETESPVSEDALSDHCYDGIQEYDNPTPGWWNWLFILSILLAPLYLAIFHSPYQDLSLIAQYDRAKNENLRKQFGKLGDLEPTAENILKYMDDPKWSDFGKNTFQTYCISCHGKEGQGISGPNLTDESYLNIKKIDDIAKVVKEGAKAGAMPAWGSKLHTNEVVFVSAYVASLRGTNVQGKQAEGNQIEPWPTAGGASTDSPPE